MDAAAWRVGYTHEFAVNTLKAYEKQLKKEMYECQAAAGLPNDLAEWIDGKATRCGMMYLRASDRSLHGGAELRLKTMCL